MAQIAVFEIKSGISIKYILEYFDELGLLKIEDDLFKYLNCTIKVTESCNPLIKTILIPQNLIVIRGDECECKKFISAFRLKFLSAGG